VPGDFQSTMAAAAPVTTTTTTTTTTTATVAITSKPLTIFFSPGTAHNNG